jgi:hypothetical protein
MEIKNNNYEEVKYGPITITRDGRYAHFKSDFTPEGFRKYIENLKFDRIALKKK